jgi:hypothetical protein
LDEATVAFTIQVTDPPAGIVIPLSEMSPVPEAANPEVPAVPVAFQLGVPSAAAKESDTVAS